MNLGICGTCARPAMATMDNEGYSSCCNDRIEYGEEAEETVAAEIQDLTEQLLQNEAAGADVSWIERSIERLREVQATHQF